MRYLLTLTTLGAVNLTMNLHTVGAFNFCIKVVFILGRVSPSCEPFSLARPAQRYCRRNHALGAALLVITQDCHVHVQIL